MRSRLPVHIENRELPFDKTEFLERDNSSGYVNILFLASVIATIASIMTIVVLGNR